MVLRFLRDIVFLALILIVIAVLLAAFIVSFISYVSRHLIKRLKN